MTSLPPESLATRLPYHTIGYPISSRPIQIQRLSHNSFEACEYLILSDSGITVNETFIDLGGLSISFHGHGNIAGKPLLALARILFDNLSTLKEMVPSWEKTEKGLCCLSHHVIRHSLLRHQRQTNTHRKMPETIMVYVRNTATASDQGELGF